MAQRSCVLLCGIVWTSLKISNRFCLAFLDYLSDCFKILKKTTMVNDQGSEKILLPENHRQSVQYRVNGNSGMKQVYVKFVICPLSMFII